MEKKERYHLIDGIRGLTLISMIIYHACWDLVYLFDINIQGYIGIEGFIWQQSICWSFIILSGFCSNLGRRQYKRGLEVFCAGMLITLITLLFMPEAMIWWGVLTLIGSGMVLTEALKNVLGKFPGIFGAIVCFLLFILSRWADLGFIGLKGVIEIKLPSILYSNILTAYFGFPDRNFYSTDYFPLIPWIFLYLSGYYLYNILQPNSTDKKIELPGIFRKSIIKPLEFIGRHSLFIYMIHQPLIYFALSAVFHLKK